MIQHPETTSPVIDRATFEEFAEAYGARWDVGVYAVDNEGRIVYGELRCPSPEDEGCRQARRWAVSEGLRWGEPTIDFCPQRRLIWALPLMHNNAVLGGLVAEAPEDRVFPSQQGESSLDVRRACVDLREMAEERNLTNAALLEMRREQYHREQLRAEAIQEFKRRNAYVLREMYLREEPALMAAIRKGDRQEARGLLNRILVAIHYHAGTRLELVKSFFMELVITMCRTAVEVGGEPAALLGSNYEHIVELAHIDSEEELAPWITRMLETIMDAIERASYRSGNTQIHLALEYMRAHYDDDLSRDDMARQIGMSPSHFSRTFKKHLGRSFSDILNQMRIDRACELLARTDRDLVLIALDTGFKDQSYFQKVFRRYTGMTPGTYRKQKRLVR